MVPKESQPFTKPIGQWTIILIITMALATGAIFLYSLLQFRSTSQSSAPTPQKITPTAVAALGRIEPQGEITRLSAPNSLEGTRVTQLLVKEGDKVRAGQVVAVLDTQNRRRTALEKAQTNVQVAQAHLAQVKAGAKAGDITAQQATIANLQAELSGNITAQQATIARLQAELRNAQTQNRRYQQLYQSGAISASDSDSKRLSVDTVGEQLKEAKATLNRTVQTNQKQQSEAKAKLESISEVRPTDVQTAQAELESAYSSVKQAQADLEVSYIRAPINCQILKVHVRAGEIVGSEGIAEIGKTDQMYVVAEIYETDIKKVRLGQDAIITSEAFPSKLRGKVTQIGLQVNKQDVFNNNPTADTDHKVIEVKISLDPASSRQVANLSNLQVQVVIHT